MNFVSRIWGSPFLDFFQGQQSLIMRQRKTVSIILANIVALVAIAAEKYWQLTLACLLGRDPKFVSLHSVLCTVCACVFAWNILTRSLQLAQCWCQLQRKFLVDSEEERRRLGQLCRSGTVGLRSRRASRQPQSLLDSVYLPSAGGSPDKSVLSDSRQARDVQAYSPSSFVPLSPVSAAGSRGSASAASPSGLSLLSAYSPSRPGPPLSRPVSPAHDLSSFFPSLSRSAEWSDVADATGRSEQPTAGAYAASQLDYSLLGKAKYQLACEPPQELRKRMTDESAGARRRRTVDGVDGRDLRVADDDLDDGERRSGWQRLTHEQTLRALGVHDELYCLEDGLAVWVKRLRVWLHGTVVHRLSQQIRRVNARLSDSGLHDLLIGQASLGHLQQRQVPGVAPLLPFLSACDDQSYAVGRIHELARCPCLSAFNWDGGSPDRWSSRLPNDSNLLMHLLATYMDQRLPPLPGSGSDSRPFSSLYLLGSAWRPEVAGRGGGGGGGGGGEMRIVRASTQPPHYQLALGNDLLDVAHGSRNLFYCLLLFFHYYIARQRGLLRQVQLGESGLNVAWIFSRGSLDIDELFYSG